MVQVVFYEKPGCINNTRQKKLLKAAGHELDARSLLTTAWTTETLRPFFQGLAVAEWFNKSAPAVKSGEVDPAALTEDEALALMLQDPLLIRRPLMLIDGEFYAGFDTERMNAVIGLAPVDGPEDLESCPRSHTESSCADDKAADGSG
jgi:nitrogenase-associated protein